MVQTACRYLPLTQMQVERTMLRPGIDCDDDMCLRFLESGLPEEIDVALDFENESLLDLNEFCCIIEPLNQLEHEKLGAVTSVAQLESASQIWCSSFFCHAVVCCVAIKRKGDDFP